MPPRLWFMLALLCGGIACGSGFALYIGIQEVRLHRLGPRQQLMAEELNGRSQGWMLVRGCARHDYEVAISPDGIVVGGERDEHDQVYLPLTSAQECDEAPAGKLHFTALVESSAATQGLSRLYAQGYQPPPTVVFVEGIIGFGHGDGRREYLARKELARRGLPDGMAGVPLLVSGKRPGSLGIAYATAAVGLHGLLLLLFLGALALRRHLRGGLPPMPDSDEPFEDQAEDPSHRDDLHDLSAIEDRLR